MTRDHSIVQLLVDILKQDQAASLNPEVIEAVSNPVIRIDPWDLTPADMSRCMLYSAASNPMSIREYLLPWSAKSSANLDRRSCFMAHLRHELGSVGLERGLCDRLDQIIIQDNPTYLFWVFLLCMDVDAGIYHAVLQTFPGPPEIFQQIFSYVYNKIAKLLQSPFFPSTAGDIMFHMRNEVGRTLLENNRSKIIREGEPEPEKLSHPRELKKKRQQTAAAAVAAAKSNAKQKRKKARMTKEQADQSASGAESGMDSEAFGEEASGTVTPTSTTISDGSASPHREANEEEENDPQALERYAIVF